MWSKFREAVGVHGPLYELLPLDWTLANRWFEQNYYHKYAGMVCFQILPGSATLPACCWLGGGGRSSMMSTKLRGKMPMEMPTCPRAQPSPTYSFSWMTSPSENDSSSLCSPSKSNLASHLGPLEGIFQNQNLFTLPSMFHIQEIWLNSTYVSYETSTQKVVRSWANRSVR